MVQSHAKTVGSVFVKVFGGEGKTFVSPIGFYRISCKGGPKIGWQVKKRRKFSPHPNLERRGLIHHGERQVEHYVYNLLERNFPQYLKCYIY